jgi:threonine synthase
MWRYQLQCFNCHAPCSERTTGFRCAKCGGLLEVRFDLAGRKVLWRNRQLSVWKYKELLPIRIDQAITTLNEGGTGLHHCQRLGRKLRLRKLFVKNEGENPTGSFKDRGMTVAISKARELGKKRVICASTGNTSASLSAYAARSGMDCTVFIPKGKIAAGKMLQVLMHGARIVQVEGNFDRALEAVVRFSEKKKELYLMNSLNPFRIEGQKTLAFEAVDQLSGASPDIAVFPVGNGGNISAAWKGFREFQELDIVKERPMMIGIQADRAAPIARAFKQKRDQIQPVANPQTLATAIRIGSPVNAPKALDAINESGGLAETVTDSEILRAQRDLARLEGIFVEPASAASIAGVTKLLDAGKVDRSELVMCVTTGHGLKDPSVAKTFPKTQLGTILDLANLSSLDALERAL